MSVQRIELTLSELHQLRDRIDREHLIGDDWRVVGALVSKLIARTEAQHQRMLNKLASEATRNGEESTPHPMESSGAGESLPKSQAPNGTNSAASRDNDESVGDGGSSLNTQTASSEESEKKKVKGHGRNGAHAFVNAKHVDHKLTDGIVGQLCKNCGPGRGAGRMSSYREKIIVRIVGQPLFGAEVHHYEQARCRICGEIIRATGPDGVLEGVGTNYIMYDWSACATLIVIHYFAAMPFKRLESLHNGWGVPLPDANQWSLVDTSADLLQPLHKAAEDHGIHHALNFRIDDTGSMVISVQRQIQAEIAALESLGESAKDVRTGINATGVYFETNEGVIILFYTGRHHAGEMIDRLLKHRTSSAPKLVKVTDGASKNFAHEQEDKLIEATCNAHAFLKFRAIKDKYPAEYAIAGEVYKQVFDNDDEAKARGMTANERMLYHRRNSKPLMEKLKAMCEDKIKSKLVEPKSLLWEPLTFIINQWMRLTKFYEKPGVPLDTNLLEQALIIPVR